MNHSNFNLKSFYKIIFVFCLLFFNTTFANNGSVIQEVNLTLNFGTPFKLPESAATIAIGDPSLFTVVTLDPKLLMITGDKIGATSLIVIGKSGTIYQYRAKVSADLKIQNDVLQNEIAQLEFEQLRKNFEDQTKLNRELLRIKLTNQRNDFVIKTQLDKLRPLIQSLEPQIRVDDLNGKIILRGEVKSAAALVRVLTMTDRFFGGTAPEPDFKVVSDQGGILAGNLDEKINQLDPSRFQELNLAISGNNPRLSRQSLLDDKANLAQNISRASIVSVANGKVLSFIKVTSQPKVEIQMRIVEIDRTKTDQFGIDWRLDGSKVTIGSTVGNVTNTLPSPRSLTDGTGSINPGTADIFGIFTPGKYFLTAFVNAMEEKGATSTLSEPLLTAISGESARFLVGGSVPIPTQTLAGGNATSNAIAVTNVRYVQFGLSITVRPTVLENGKISIVLDQSISEADYSNAIQLIGASVPGFKQKSVSTITESESGETWAVAGLLTEEDRKNLKSVPWISKVPILGKLFDNKDDSVARNELIILVNARRVDEVNSTTTTFDGMGNLEPQTRKNEQVLDSNDAGKNKEELNSQSLIQTNPNNGKNKTEEIKIIDLNKANKNGSDKLNDFDKGKNQNLIKKSKQIAFNETPSKEKIINEEIKFINLKEKNNENADVLITAYNEKKTELANSNTSIQPNAPTETEKKVAENIQQKPMVDHSSKSLPLPISSGATMPAESNALTTQPAKIEMAENMVKTAKVEEKPAPNLSKQATKNNIENEVLQKVNVVILNFLTGHEKTDYLVAALNKGLDNVPPKSEWAHWRVGVGAVDGNAKKLIKFLVSPDMRNKLHSGANAYVEIPKNQFNYALDY